jgi:hypothetical protein
MMTIFNLTQHQATPDQIKAGVKPRTKDEQSKVQELLSFDAAPSGEEIVARAIRLARLAKESGCDKAMIGGAPYLMAALQQALLNAGVEPLYAFTQRVSADSVQPDGTIKKISVFRHSGWVSAADLEPHNGGW